MTELIIVGIVAGFLAGISPCILPVLPVVLVAGASPPPDAEASAPVPRASLARSAAVIGGLILSFSIIVLAGSAILSLLHLPQDALRDAGIALLVVVGLGYLIPPLGTLLERPFARVGTRQPNGRAGGFVLGLAVGVVYVPCAGPVLAAIAVVGATHRIGFTAVILTAAFAVGTAVPLFAVALAGGQLTSRIGAIRKRAPRIRQVGGVVLVVMAVVIASDVLSGLQRDIPGYTTALQGSAKVRNQLNALTGVPHTTLTDCSSTATKLVNCGPAPNFTGITAWLNTPGGKPLSLTSLRGKVVLVDFWTYSCINCQRTLPHVEAWYRQYAKDGFVVVGVHTPEFAFEHVVSNVRAQATSLGVKYPVAVDDNYATWNAYDNEYWPADYLIDANGDVRHVNFGEGDYTTTGKLIRQLLQAAHPSMSVPNPAGIPDKTPTTEMSPETYIGYERLQYLDTTVTRDAPSLYHFPASLPLGQFGLAGIWTDHSQEATAGRGAELELGFLAQDIYLVLGGTGTLNVSVNGHHIQTIHVGGIPRLYTLYQTDSPTSGKLLLQASPGIQAYDFTFG
ncbi:MAG TPA: cytochrome c biogenesis protein DipZ [Streptosporangiaceae bacterium]|jgi:cytochrome c biogenesis protein CcdA/thiol-disulfide isomerase/thioredoxin